MKNDNPLKEQSALYNIYTLSFNNIKGSASELERGRSLVRLDRLETRAKALQVEYGYIKLDRLSLVRKTRPEYSSLQWRLTLPDGKRVYVALYENAMELKLADVSTELRDTVHLVGREVQLLNANLKVQWTHYLEHCYLTHLPEEEWTRPKHFTDLN